MHDQGRGQGAYHNDILLGVDGSQGGASGTRGRGHEGKDGGGQEGKDGEAQVEHGCVGLVDGLVGCRVAVSLCWWRVGGELRIHLK